MKNGRPSLLFDVRYFLNTKSNYWRDDWITAYGRRIAWYLNGEGLSLGSFHSLYLCFSTTLEPDSISTTEQGSDWWQRYVYVGVPKSFPDAAGSREVAMRGTVAALKALCPDAKDLIDAADQAVRAYGGDLRFLVRAKPYKDYVLQAATTISVHPNPTTLYFSVLSRTSGETVELPPIEGGMYFQAFSETSGIRLSDIEIRRSADGKLLAKWQTDAVLAAKENAQVCSGARPSCYSKMVKSQ